MNSITSYLNKVHSLSFLFKCVMIIYLMQGVGEVILISLAILTQAAIQELPYTEFFEAFYTVIRVGNPPQSLLEGINLAHPFTVTTDFFFNISYSATIQIFDSTTSSFNIDTKVFEGIRLIDKVKLPRCDAVVDGFSFFIIKNHEFDSNKRRTGISFAYQLANSSLSLVHLLKESNYISRLSFAIVPNSNPNDKGIISIGGINPVHIENKSVSKCRVDYREPHIGWSCKLSLVFIGELSYETPEKNVYYANQDYAYFQSSTKLLIAPKRFIGFLHKKLLDPLIEAKHCLKEKSTWGQFKCSLSSMALMPSITFIFDDTAYSFNITEFFSCLIDWCDLYINQNEDDAWMFGTVFLRKFVMNFDYEDSTITFYSNETRSKVHIDKLIPRQYWTYLCVFIGTLLISIYAFYACAQRRRSRKAIGGKSFQKFIEKDYQVI